MQAEKAEPGMPADNARLTMQQAFYVAISRARGRAELVTDDARKLADQLEKAAGERVAALNCVAWQAAHETALGIMRGAERGPGQAVHAREATERGHEAGREAPWEYGRGSGAGYETDRDRDGSLPETGAERHRSGHWRDRSHKPERETAADKSMEPAQKSVELCLGM